jgi:hypothetical protein
MEWNQSDVLALAMEKCSTCGGYGMRPSRTGQQAACNCVLRSIFRACFQRFQNCMLRKDSIGRPNLEHTASPHGKVSWARKNEEFIADFLLVTKRTLSEAEYKIFKYHFLLGADWKLCCRKLKMEKGVFFHILYRMTAKLGKTFAELEPYALYPLSEYFYGEFRGERPKVVSIQPAKSLSQMVPLKKAA